MHKFTTKELLYIQGDHDVFNCDVPGCQICERYFKYQMDFKIQSDIMDLAERGKLLSEISDNLCLTESYVSETVQAVTGLTISALYTQQYQNKIEGLVKDGLSIPSIAKRLKKPVSTLRYYISHNDLARPDGKTVQIDIIYSASGDARYFDKQGNEVMLTKKKDGELY